MTIASRNTFIRIGAVLSFALLVTSVVSAALVIMRHGLPEMPPGPRPLALLDHFPLTPWSPVASMAAIGVYPLFALLCLGYILFAFEKTQTVEITLFSACACAISLEAFRIFIPFYKLWIHTGFYAETVSRIAYFSRILALILLLASAIFTTGETIQQLAPSIFILAFFSFSLSNVIPVNTGSMLSCFTMEVGYGPMLNIFFFTFGLLSAVSYVILGKTRGVREYMFAAGGIVLFLAGYALLAMCDTWIFLLAGSALLFAGAGLYLDRIHRYYLWQ